MVVIPFVIALSVFSQTTITREQFLDIPSVVLIKEISGEEEASAFFNCLSGNVYGAWYEPTDSYLVCPGYYLPSSGDLLMGDIEITERVASQETLVDIPWVDTGGTNYWMALIVSRGFDIWFGSTSCANRFPVVDEKSDSGEVWKGVLLTQELGKEECLPSVVGRGNIVVFVSPHSLSLKRTNLEEFSPPTREQSAPSEVAGLEAVSFLPEPIRIGWEVYDLISLTGGIIIICLTGLLSSILLDDR